MNHFVCFPSADPKRGDACAKRWSERGYQAFVMYDVEPNVNEGLAIGVNGATHILWRPKPFKGYYKVINDIVRHAFDLGADCVTCIGDDQDPPDQGAQFMAERYFSKYPEGDGVMQPCGDPQGEVMVVKGFEHLGPIHNAGRICGSPVFGRKWAETGYKSGAFCDEYRSFYGDEDLWNVAMKRGKLWLDKETQHFHRHWSFGMSHRQPYHEKAQQNWDSDQQTFMARKAAGFL